MKKHFLPLILGLAGVFAIATAFGTGDEPLDEPEDDGVVLGEEDLAERGEILRNQFRRMTPSDEPLVQDIGTWPAAWEEFGTNWDSAAADREYGAWVVPVEVEQTNGATVIRDGTGLELWRGTTDFTRPESADVVLTGGLVAEEDWAVYEAVRGAVEEMTADASRVDIPVPMRSHPTNGLRFTSCAWTTNDSFHMDLAYEVDTNVDLFVYAVAHTSAQVVATWTNDENVAVTDTNTVWYSVGEPFNGRDSTWEYLDTVAIDNGEAEYEDSGFPAGLGRLRYYAAAVAQDSDGDGLSDGEEAFAWHTDPMNTDSDGDGWGDGLEVATGFEPWDEMEHPKVMIQAVMYKPTPSGDTNEWVELYSTSKKPVPLAGARLEIGRTGEWVSAVAFTNGEIIVPGRCLLVGGSAVTNVDVPAVLDIPDSGATAPMTGVRLAWGVGATLTVADVVMIGGSATNFNADGLDTTGWLSDKSVWSSPGNILERRYAGVDTDRKEDWGWWGQRPGRNSEEAVDSDNDGLSDGGELLGTANPWHEPTNPLLSDSDGDGLTDAEECLVYGTNPLTWASDGDIYPWMPAGTAMTNWPGTDSYEVAHGHDPFKFDENTNGIPDSWEWALGSENLLSGADSDGDGISDLEEMRQNSNPTNASHATPADFVMLFRATCDNWTNGAPDNDIGLGGRVEVTFFGAAPGTSIGVQVSEGRFPEPFTMKWADADVICAPTGNVSVQGFASAYACIQPNGPRLSLSYPRLIVQDARLHPESGEDAGGEYYIQAFTARLVPDCDRNHAIDAADRAALTTDTPFRWWVNDDDDDGDIADGDSDVPGQGSLLDNANCDNDQVDGRCDLLDFFPVWLDVESLFSFLPPGENMVWKLRHGNEAVRVAYTDLSTANAGDFLFVDSDTYGADADEMSYEAQTVEISASGTTLPPAFLSRLSANPSQGVLLVEGVRDTAEPLVLEIDGPDGKLYETALPLCLTAVESFYRWLNLRSSAGGSGGRDTNLSEPSNRPDGICNDIFFVFVHGYNVNAEQARAWNAEMFKRLHQSGSNAKFLAVDWWGDESQVWVPVVGTITPDYYVNVEHAFATASNLAVSINQMSPGRKVVAAHSLGNVLVASAIVDHELVASSFFMLNAAVPVEAFADVPVETNMVNPDWRGYASYLWASKWHEAFPSTDGRHALSWCGRFANLTNYCNFYSSTEDVLDNVGTNIPYPQRQWAWGTQELHKGTTYSYWMPGHCEGGWGFNGDYDPWFGHFPTPQEATNLVTMDTLQTNSLFRRFDDLQLYTPAGNAFARQPVIRARLLADAIPALSFAAGRNPLPDTTSWNSTSVNLMNHESGEYPLGWPRESQAWQHSDLKEVAYYYLYSLFDYIVLQGELR